MAQECFANVRTVKTFSSETTEMAKYEVFNHSLYKISVRRFWWMGLVSTIWNTNGYFAMLAIIYKGASMVADGTTTIGTLTTFMM